MNKIIITGAAGFIGFHLSRRLLEEGYEVIGIDNFNNYYDVQLKEDRMKLINNKKFKMYRCSLEDKEEVFKVFDVERPDTVINLAAQAGVRYSLDNPHAYIDSNINGFINILESCRHYKIKHLIYASSSSVYGANENLPFSTKDNVDHPLSLYAATKKANELMAHTYSSLYGLATTGLRFFTVYGPWGRPDMALFKFTKNIVEGQPIDIYNNGKMMRDFTYVDDIVEAITRLLKVPAQPNKHWDGMNPDPSSSYAPYKVYNIGNNSPVLLMDFIEAIEQNLSVKANKNFMELQPGDVPKTYANVDELYNAIEFRPQTNIKDGVRKFVEWYVEYYGVNLK